MQQIQPLVQKINDKYKGIPMNDPRKTDQNAELMDLYKAHGINPVGGCLPMLIQIPSRDGTRRSPEPSASKRFRHSSPTARARCSRGPKTRTWL